MTCITVVEIHFMLCYIWILYGVYDMHIHIYTQRQMKCIFLYTRDTFRAVLFHDNFNYLLFPSCSLISWCYAASLFPSFPTVHFFQYYLSWSSWSFIVFLSLNCLHMSSPFLLWVLRVLRHHGTVTSVCLGNYLKYIWLLNISDMTFFDNVSVQTCIIFVTIL